MSPVKQDPGKPPNSSNSVSLESHQVLIVSGETGSGKTTQLPKFCLEAGRGRRGRIALTQPRRVAATSISRQIAHELETEVGRMVGYRIRFSEKHSEETLIQVMTDGMLLAETRSDRFLINTTQSFLMRLTSGRLILTSSSVICFSFLINEETFV